MNLFFEPLEFSGDIYIYISYSFPGTMHFRWWIFGFDSRENQHVMISMFPPFFLSQNFKKTSSSFFSPQKKHTKRAMDGPKFARLLPSHLQFQLGFDAFSGAKWSRSSSRPRGWIFRLGFLLAVPWKSKTKQRIVFGMIHVKDSLLPRGKV